MSTRLNNGQNGFQTGCFTGSRQDLGSWKNECLVVREVLKLDTLFCRGLVLFSKGHIKPCQCSLSCAHSPKHKEIWDTREEKSTAIFLSCVNPVVSTMPSHHIFLWCSINSFKCYLFQIFFPSCHLLSSFFSSLGFHFLWILFLSFYPH